VATHAVASDAKFFYGSLCDYRAYRLYRSYKPLQDRRFPDLGRLYGVVRGCAGAEGDHTAKPRIGEKRQVAKMAS
jgi:hypothetical protein